jgi:plastocyanin
LKRLVFTAVVMVLGAAALAACGGGGSDKPAPTPEPTKATPQATAAPTEAASSTSAGDDVVKVVNRDPGGSGKYEFSPPELTFSVGETATFQVSAETEFHTFEVDELDISHEMEAGQTIEFTVTFDKAGTFEFYCVPHEALGMTGTITVN